MGEAAEDAIDRDMAMDDWEEEHPDEWDDPLDSYETPSRPSRNRTTNMSDKPTIEAEVIPTQAVAVRQPGGLATIQDMDQAFAVAVHQRELLADYIGKQLKPGKHFYQRGDSKPSLTKEGAEIILLPHNLCPDYEQTGGPVSPPEDGRPYQITIKCTLRIKGQPNSFVGSGIGSAGSEKGYWNKGNWEYQPRQTDKYLCHNATLKMAQKSAMIAATINSTAASEFFTQDMDEPGAPPAEEPKPKAAAAPAAAPAKPKEKTDAYRTAFIKHIGPAMKDKAVQFLIELKWILPTEGLEDVSLTHVPEDKAQMEVFMNCLRQFVDDGTVVVPYGEEAKAPAKSVPHGIEVPRDKNMDPDSPDAPWRKFPVPFGKHAGTKLADLDKNVLYGFWANFKAEETWTDNKGEVRKTKPDKLAKDRLFREMLNEAGAHYEFTAPEDDLNY